MAFIIIFAVAASFAIFGYTAPTIPTPTVAVAQPVAAPPSPSPSPLPTPTITPAPTPTPTPTLPPPSKANILAVGDLLCLGAQLSDAHVGKEYIFDQCFAQIKPIISSADLALGNLETLIAQDYPYTATKKYEEITVTPTEGPPYTTMVSVGGSPILNAPESYLRAVMDSGFDVFATANNHAFDRGANGVLQTMQKLNEYGAKHTGSYTLPDDKKPLIVTVNGINIGVVSFTDISNKKPSGDSAFMLDRYNEEQLAASIAAAKSAGADFIAVYIHWGNENTHKVTSRQKKMAQFIADSGADIILGSHAHCTQPFASIETERGPVPVIYSMGNFIGSMGRTINKDSVIVSFVLEKDNATGETKLLELTYIPTLCANTADGNYVVLPADLNSIATSKYANSLTKSRNRTIAVLGTEVALPQ